MRNDVLRWSIDSGWSAPFPAAEGDRTVVLAFGSSELTTVSPALEQLVEAYPDVIMAGASTSGAFADTELSIDGLIVSITTFDSTRVRSRSIPLVQIDDTIDLAEAFGDLGRSARAVMVIADGKAVNGDLVVERLFGALAPGVPMFGGLAGDGARFVDTWTLVDGKPQSGYGTIVTFHGDRLEAGWGVSGGWHIFGPRRTVTRSEGCVLYELDGQPALELYRRYLGDRADGLPGTALLFPLSVAAPDRTVPVVRTVLSIDEATQSMTFAGQVPIGSVTQLMRANLDNLIDGAANAGTAAEAGAGTALAFGVSCVGRQIVLGERTEEEVEAAYDELSPDTTFVGFYSHGEIGPNSDGRTQLHNQTMTIMTLREMP
ncbi:FIST C-terminal domain-containing protein [Actinoplanes sp. TRM 88003]|uniref:FIST C-terminal domain-containing protein n=1 Tax=Paractinoplanes aksuensis TaxID=2939490 RepID=A0ABT1DXH0_9ACTN|nr:FIST N-terminal domain-containing protein [Actinoplanes aksuensis]MCO8275577.1 FIST C-terminal domain-containing protein [Actinoplanes aksuensis]